MTRLRPAVPADIPSIAAIYAHHVLHGTASFEITPPDAAEIGRRRDNALQYGLPYLVAEAGPTIVGYAYATPYRPRPAYRFTIEDSIYVHHAHVGKGIGRQLLAALIHHCEQGPWHQMIAVIGDSANTPSIRLHEQLGFVPAGILKSVGWKFDRWLDTVLMQRNLKDNAPFTPD